MAASPATSSSAASKKSGRVARSPFGNRDRLTPGTMLSRFSASYERYARSRALQLHLLCLRLDPSRRQTSWPSRAGLLAPSARWYCTELPEGQIGREHV